MPFILVSCQVPDAGAADLRATPGDRPATRHFYGDSAREFYDLYLPSGTPRGVVAYVHGGAWIAGDARWLDIPAYLRALVDRGFALASIEYDLAPSSPEPVQVAEVRRATSEIAGFFGSPVALAGHSAGAHIAGLAALANNNVSSAVLLASPGSLSRLASTPGTVWGYSRGGIVSAALGCSGVDPNGANVCSRATLRKADLERKARSSSLPAYIAYGLLDDVVPPEQTERLATAWMKSAGVERVWVDVVEGAGHALDGVNTSALEAFLEQFSPNRER